MIPTFTIVTTLITIGVTALLIGILLRINNPQRQPPARRGDGSDDGPIYAVGGGPRSQREDSSNDGESGGDAGDGGGDGGGGGD